LIAFWLICLDKVSTYRQTEFCGLYGFHAMKRSKLAKHDVFDRINVAIRRPQSL
jgi:hypothetical protein